MYPKGDFKKFKEALDKVSEKREEYSKTHIFITIRFLNDRINYCMVQGIYEKAAVRGE